MTNMTTKLYNGASHFLDYVCGIEQTAFAKPQEVQSEPLVLRTEINQSTKPMFIQQRETRHREVLKNDRQKHDDDIMLFVRLVQKKK